MKPATREPWQSMLSREQQKLLNAELRYAPDTGIFTWVRSGRGRWKRAGEVAGSLHSGGYIRIGVLGIDFFAHRLAYLFMTGDWPANEVDHINGVRSDNRWGNLRSATCAENRRNCAGHPSRLISQFKGVTSEHRSNRFKAQITVNGKTFKLGHFDNEVDASAAYQRAATAMHGEFAKW